MKKSSSGFTIVELIVVIVVLTILATISIVTFSDLRDKAQNSAKIYAAQQIAKLFNSVVVDKSADLGKFAAFCLPVGSRDVSGDGIPDCGIKQVAGEYNRSERSTSNANLASFGISNLSFPDDELVDTSGVRYKGIQMTYGHSSYGVDGTHQPYHLFFFLKGNNVNCSSDYSIKVAPGVDRVANPLNAYTSGDRYASAGGVTHCAYTIKHPSTV